VSAGRAAVLILVSVLATAGLGWLARAPYTSPGADGALLRLSWRLRGEKSETCRPRTQAELDALPVHMRTPEVCESTLLAYRLVVQVDGATRDSVVVLPGGARGDRPVFVLREVPLAPGEHRVSVRFVRERAEDDDEDDDDDDARDDEHREDHGSRRRRDDARHVSLAIDTVVFARAGDIQLITLSPDGSHFVHVAPANR
jgi:hypothetical protein